jgi:hypothetical protein
LSEEEQIKRLKDIALTASITDTRKKVIDALSAYGPKAIPAITEIVGQSTITETRLHGLETIKRMKEKQK